jgi:hypothetical protein
MIIFNSFLNRKEECYKETKKNLSLKDMKHELALLKDKLPWLKEADSIFLQNSLEYLETLIYQKF